MAKTYTIFKGWHISHLFPRLYENKTFISFTVNFDKSCLYHFGNDYDLDVNKLYGLGFGLIHDTSDPLIKIFPEKAEGFRIGWNSQKNNGKIQLFAFYDNDSARSMVYLCDVNVNEDYSYYLYFDRALNKVFVDVTQNTLNIAHTSFAFSFANCPNWGFYLFPYFGGTQTAPNKMQITITDN